MKIIKTFLLISTIFAILFFVSCSEDDKSTGPEDDGSGEIENTINPKFLGWWDLYDVVEVSEESTINSIKFIVSFTV